MVERLNCALGNSLRALLLEHQPQEWDYLLPQIMRTLRATPHSSTGEMPNYLMVGRETRLPPELMMDGMELKDKNVEEFAIQL